MRYFFCIAAVLTASPAFAQYVYGPGSNPQTVTGTANNSGTYVTPPPVTTNPTYPGVGSGSVTGSVNPYGGVQTPYGSSPRC